MKDKSNKIVQLQVKILLAKAIIKNWNQATEPEKKDIKRWWIKTYGEFKN